MKRAFTILKITLIALVVLPIFAIAGLRIEILIYDSMQTGFIMDRPNTKWISEDESVSIEIGDEMECWQGRAASGICNIQTDDYDISFEIQPLIRDVGVDLVAIEGFHIDADIFLLSDDSFYMQVYSVYSPEPIGNDFPLRNGKWIKFNRTEE